MSTYSRIPSSEDEDRLPHGLSRIGYDADTQQYTYVDETTGQIFEGQPGNRYGLITPTNQHLTSTRQATTTNENSNSTFTGHEDEDGNIRMHFDTDIDMNERQNADWGYLAPFLLLVGLFLLLVMKFVFRDDGSDTPGSVHDMCPDRYVAYVVHNGDTCWKIAEDNSVKVGDLVGGNGGGIDCDRLAIGATICIPDSTTFVK